MSNANFFRALHGAYHDKRDRPFLTMPSGESLSYGEIDVLTARMAGALLAAGAKPGDRIAVQVEKSPENVALYLGAMRAGLTYVPLNTAYTADEVDYFLNDAQPAIFVCAPDREAALAPVAMSAGVKRTCTLGAMGEGSLASSVKDAAPFDEITNCEPSDIAVILYTSGTTGRSKGAMLTHENLRSNAAALNRLWEFTGADVLLHALPIFHIHGLFVALHTVMLSACKILFLRKFDVDAVLEQLPRASVMMGVPTFYSRLLARPDFNRDTAAHMRLFISGSAPLTPESFAAFEARTGKKLLERYGMSEAGMIASNPLHGDRIAGTVGFTLPGVDIRIAGDAPGEVEIRGPNVFAGYWEKPDKTAEAFTDDGWFRTGDIGLLSAGGRLTLAGREKDLIIAGGYNIYPVEIEQALDAVPGVAESAVIGAPHPDMGEGVIAVIVENGAGAGDQALCDAMERLARFKRPRRYIRVEVLPRNAMGKVQKQLLRETYRNSFTDAC